MITALFWAIAEPVVAIPYRNSGQPISAISKGQEPSARNYHYSLRNSPEEHSSQRERTSGSSKLPFSLKSPHQNPVCIFQITSNLTTKTLYASSKLHQISPPKPCMHLPNYLKSPHQNPVCIFQIASNLPTKTLYASSKLPLSLKSPYQNPVCIFQITSFTQISSPKPYTHIPNYLKSPYQNPVCIFQITPFTQISPPKPCMHLPNYLLPSNYPTKTLFAFSKLTISLKSPHQNPVCTCPLPHTCHIPRPSHSYGLDRPSNIW
jgi:hypothetical protein